MHICFIAWDYPEKDTATGGIGVFVRTLATALVKKGHSISVVAQSRTGKYVEHQDNGIRIIRIVAGSIPFFGSFQNVLNINAAIRNLNKKQKIDILETSETQGAFVPHIRGMKHVVRLHGGHLFFADAEKRKIRPVRRWLEKRTLCRADAIVAVSNYVLEQTKTLHNIQLQGSVIRNAIEINRFKVDAKETKYTFVYIGWIVPKKGVGELLDAFSKLVKLFPESTLALAGKSGVDAETGLTWQRVYARRIPKEIQSKINFLGPLPADKVPQLLAEAQIVVLPSHMEALPMAWLEAMASGKPLIATNIKPASEIITHGQHAFLVEPQNINALFWQMNWCLQHEAVAKRVGETAQAHIESQFNVKHAVTENESFYVKTSKLNNVND